MEMANLLEQRLKDKKYPLIAHYSALSIQIHTDKADYKIQTCQIPNFSHQFVKVISDEPIKTGVKSPVFLISIKK